eukprot:scaffold25841_cov69-Phaeocystis_antarctica.AAC.3
MVAPLQRECLATQAAGARPRWRERERACRHPLHLRLVTEPTRDARRRKVQARVIGGVRRCEHHAHQGRGRAHATAVDKALLQPHQLGRVLRRQPVEERRGRALVGRL